MSSSRSASELARRLARNAEAACRRYLPKGRREGAYWLVGDVRGSTGRSLYVRLKGPESGKGAAGRWTDAATAEHGDLLDLIGLNLGLACLGDALDEARRFLGEPQSRQSESPSWPSAEPRTSQDSVEAARRLFARSRPLKGTIAETYLGLRGIAATRDNLALRFHPRCFYRDVDAGRLLELPAMIAAVTDDAGVLTGVHRTWLSFDGGGKASVASPRRAMGHLLGGGVRFGTGGEASPILFAGEGLETMLSLRMAMPLAPAIAALSANHLAAILFPALLRRLYVAVDADAAGRRALERLSARGREAGIEVFALHPVLGDFNDDLRRLGLGALQENLRAQLMDGDAERFLPVAGRPE
jgi:Toprim domain